MGNLVVRSLKKTDTEEIYIKTKIKNEQHKIVKTKRHMLHKEPIKQWLTRVKDMLVRTNCVICNGPSIHSCDNCKTIQYCSFFCKNEDKNNDLHKCLPYKIGFDETCGRMLVASRDIAAGEILFTDARGAVGLRTDDPLQPVCLNCYKTLSGMMHKCSTCHAPLCGPSCEGREPHIRECSLFKEHSSQLNELPIEN